MGRACGVETKFGAVSRCFVCFSVLCAAYCCGSPAEAVDVEALQRQQLAEKLAYLERPDALAGDEAQTTVKTLPVEPSLQYSEAVGTEGFEDSPGDFADYWNDYDADPAGGLTTWGVVNCQAYEGIQSAWCAGSKGYSDCVAYDSFQDSYLTIDCQYLGLSTTGTNRFRFLLNSQLNTGAFAAVIFHGWASCPTSNQTPDVTSEVVFTASTNGWEVREVTLGSAFNPMLYVRVLFRFRSQTLQFSGVYVDNVLFHGTTANTQYRLYPIRLGFCNTPIPTPSHTPSHTPTATPSRTPSNTATFSPSATPSNTPVNTLSPTPTNTAPTPTPTNTLAATSTPTAPCFVWGDVDGNSISNALDASLVLRWDAFLIDFFPCCPGVIVPAFPQRADVNGSNSLTAFDASLILQYDAFILGVFPADLDGNGRGPEGGECDAAPPMD